MSPVNQTLLPVVASVLLEGAMLLSGASLF